MRINRVFRLINRANALLFFGLALTLCVFLVFVFYAESEEDQRKRPVRPKHVVKPKSAAIPAGVTFHSSQVDGDISIIYVRSRYKGNVSDGIVFYNHAREKAIKPFADGKQNLISYRLIPELGTAARYAEQSPQQQVDDPQYVAAIVEEKAGKEMSGSVYNLYALSIDGSRMELVATDIIKIIDAFAKEDDIRIFFKDGSGMKLAVLGAGLEKKEIVRLSGNQQ